ncbi:MAG: hypothetical protein A3G34_01645 [Candidatus Lindowbacteria bacterium RIFCSPLOWO2_12_FULL_62_27]|nr:MAG: hypothetical protein A3I06_05585 [Candidatus Lindowbacteria bacterium RIFCSPLOWO2_02_FULL_62_12]OGH59014.1 MAG: hypothetical protein A3G34_01645 [Candidatus Lindowbacteria bacterium RIFCSPLOWO2_12_FULL_62_27]
MTDSIRIGMIGCGRIAQTHFEALDLISECKVAGVCDTEEARAKSVAERYGAPCHTDYRKFLDTVPMDGVIVCTPPVHHAEQALYAFERRIPVLCEKPLCMNVAESRALMIAQEKAGVVGMPASKFCFCADVVKAKAIIQSGLLGKILLYENVFTGMNDMRGRWNSKKEISGGGVLFDNGSHSLDIARFLLGEIESVQATVGIQIQDIEVEDTAKLSIHMKNGVLGVINLSWSMKEDREDFVSVYGNEGTLRVGWAQSRYRQANSNEWVVFGKGYSKVDSFVKQNRHFIQCIRGDASPLLNLQDGFHAVNIMMKSYESLEKNRWIKTS